MHKLPKKFVDRISSTSKRFQTIANSHRTKDVSEADTVTLIKDILADMFGYDKYSELTSEYQIKGTFCDLAIRIENKVRFLVEVKSAGTDLNNSHIRQATNYGANQGIEWIILTNALDWRFFRIKFGQPIDIEEMASFNLNDINSKKEETLQKPYLISREGIDINAISDFHNKIQIFNRHTVAQVLLSEPVVTVVRRELRRYFPDVRFDIDAINQMLQNDLIKREVLEGDKSKEAASLLKKAQKKHERAQVVSAATKDAVPDKEAQD
jgi:hypothetical protein